MLRILSLAAVSILLAGAAAAQEPDAARPKVVKVHALMKSGARLQVIQPDIIEKKLCGYVRAANAAPGAAWAKDCVALADVADTRVEGAGHALGDSVRGSLCGGPAPFCFAKIAMGQNRLVEAAIDKAGAR